MVERIHKVESDPMRVERKEEAADEHEDKSNKKDKSDQETEEHDEFAPKLDFKKWTDKQISSARKQPSLWQEKLERQSGRKAEERAAGVEVEEKTVEEATTSTTITFLRAAGLLSLKGEPRWGTIGLYALAFFGFLVTLAIVIHAFL